MTTTAVPPPPLKVGATPRLKSHRSSRRVTAIRVWSDSGDTGLELLVVEQASEEQQLASKLSSLRTALDHCKEHINSANTSPTALTLAETAGRLRGILTELSNLDKTITNKGISYASEEQSAPITEADLPSLPISSDSPPPSPGAIRHNTKPSHRQVAALRSYCQDLLVKCVEDKQQAEQQQRQQSGSGIISNKDYDEDLNEEKRDNGDNRHKDVDEEDNDKAVVGATVAAALANEPGRMPQSTTSSSTSQSPSNKSPKNGSNPLGDVFQISRWGELLREPRPPLTKEQLKKRQIMITRDEERELKWIKMIKDWDRYSKHKKDKLKSRIRKGIPDSLRANVWPRFTGAIEAMKKAEPGLYRKRLAEECELSEVISRDIARTFPNHLLFRDELGSSGGDGEDVSGSNSSGRQSLFNVLKAYANHDKIVGYCQGMGFIVGLFLMYMSEEEAFWMLDRVMRSDKFMMHGLYAIGFPLLTQYFYQFDQLLCSLCPAVHDHLQMHSITPTLYATQWFMTVFSYNMPFELVLRIWDIYLYEGPKIPFRFALSFIQRYQQQILKEEDLEGVIMILKEVHLDKALEDTDAVIEAAMNVKLKRKELSDLAKEYDQQQLYNKMAAGNKQKNKK